MTHFTPRLRSALLSGLACAAALPFSAAAAEPVGAGLSASGGVIEIPIRPRSAPLLYAELQPVPNPVGPPESPEAGSCPSQISTYTDSDFGPGAYVLQGGFVETGIAAKSFVIPANAFPILIESAEMIFGTQATNQTTTTHWSFLVWQGPPNTGTLVDEFSSDGLILPHLVIPPGTHAVNVMVMVDPGDPDQIIVQGSPSNTFSIGFRIDKHHNPYSPALACFLGGGPSTSNAFPATDTSGLANPAGNWIRSIDCGSSGCIPGGGWASFQTLPSACTPSGDWVMRVTWRSLNCAQIVGACCLPDGSCTFQSQVACDAAGGLYQGDNVLCVNVTCPPNLLGSCCILEQCVNGTLESECVNAGGIFQGIGTNCTQIDCNPLGACCFAGTGGCLTLNEANCAAAGGVFNGGATCSTFVCFPSGACCLPDGTCLGGSTGMTPEDCTAKGGTFQGDGTNCDTFNCPIADGACCFSGTGGCLILSPSSCSTAGGVFAGGGTTCPDGCVPACPADFNGDGQVNSTDLLDLLNAWGPCPGCPQDLNGDGQVNSTDLLELLNAWGPC